MITAHSPIIVSDDKKVFVAVLPERCMYDLAVQSAMRVMYRAGELGYVPMWLQYGRTDWNRQSCAEAFLRSTKNDDDTLVMLDIDHDHPKNIVEKLVADDKDVVVPLMFRRGEPYQCCAFRRTPDGVLHHIATFPAGLHKMDALGAGALAIKRKVFTTLQAAGHCWFWKYEYKDNLESPSEDLYFSKICGEAGVEMWLDCDIETPHITYGFIDRSTHDEYFADHPELGNLITVRKE